MKATEELKNEHEGIKLMLRIMESVSKKIGQGEKVPFAHLDGILEFLTVFIDKCHHGKEEEFLFPAMESMGIPREGGPIGVMLAEHEMGRKIVSRLKKDLADLKSGESSAESSFQKTVKEYVSLLTQHIEKENTVLFPMADVKLSTDTDTRLFDAFERLERERIGTGKHEEFHAFLSELNDIYLLAFAHFFRSV